MAQDQSSSGAQALQDQLSKTGITGLSGTKVFWGEYDSSYFGSDPASRDAAQQRGTMPRPLSITQTEAENKWYGFSEHEQQTWANKLYRAGLISDPGDYDAVFAQWRSAVAYAGNLFTVAGRQVTPFDVLQQRMGLANKAGGTKTQTDTSKVVHQIDPRDAEAMVKSVYQNALGRDPSAGELSRYKSMLINKVLDSPQTTTTTTTQKGNGTNNVSTSSNSKVTDSIGSAGQQQFLQDKAEADPEYGAYQAATKYFNLLHDAFAAPA